jgi:hypothetical protein
MKSLCTFFAMLLATTMAFAAPPAASRADESKRGTASRGVPASKPVKSVRRLVLVSLSAL